MPTIHVTLRNRQIGTIDAAAGHSLMEAIRDAGVEDMLALCGGCCSCATCHVHVADRWFQTVGAAHPDEQDLLGSSDHVAATSRLACQIRLEPQHNGLAVIIAPEG
jgi:2Fe-2S ferredoxin